MRRFSASDCLVVAGQVRWCCPTAPYACQVAKAAVFATATHGDNHMFAFHYVNFELPSHVQMVQRLYVVRQPPLPPDTPVGWTRYKLEDGRMKPYFHPAPKLR